MRLIILLVFVFVLTFHTANAQYYSNDKTEFRTQVITKIRSIGTQPAYKIAFDFKNAWDKRFLSIHQDKAHEIALSMQKKGYQFYPFFYHYFTYLAYSVAQENLQRDQLIKLLEINEQVVQTLSKSEYKEFLFGLNIYFARRYLSLDKNLSVQALEGSYDFKLLDKYGDTEEIEENIPTFISKDEISVFGEDTFNDDDEIDSWSYEPEETAAYETPKTARQSYSPLIPDYLATKQKQYVHPKPEGPIIEIKNARVVLSTPNDTLKIKSVNGSFLLKNRMLVCDQGSIDWPAQNSKFRGSTVQLNNFHLKKDRSDFWTPSAKFQFDQLIGDELIEGVFEYRSIDRPRLTLSTFPIFTSNNANHIVKLNDDKLSYIGGIQIKGNQLFGKSVSREKGTLKILDGRGNTVVLRSEEFNLGDSLVSMNSGSITILHGIDSIFHKSVRAKFDLTTRRLFVLRNSTLTAYESSYFGVSMNVDLIKWNMEIDSITLDIMNGKDLLPATFESGNFFDLVRYQKLGRFLDFHPINIAVHYSRKYDVDEFYVDELALEYGIDKRFSQGAGKILSQYGFAKYDGSTGLLKLSSKAFLYYDASAESVDFDNLMIPSLAKKSSNAYIQLDSGKLEVRGVSRFYLTTNFKIYAEPSDSTVTILKNRNLEFDGIIHSGDFQYNGVGHQFDYDEFLVSMPQIDSMHITVSLKDTINTNAPSEKVPLDNPITETSGVLYLNKKDNKSGVKENTEYPYFISDSEAVIYFNSKKILNGAYDKSVKFILPPFDIDSMNLESEDVADFVGVFNSGGIFPSFAETLSIQDDRSMGFVHKIPEEGYNLYGTEATTYEEIQLSNTGIRGYGKIDFLTTTIYSDDFIYYPDSVISVGTGGVISPGMYKGTSFPEAVLGTYDMHWIPRRASMYLHTINEPFKFYNSTAQLVGHTNITTKGVLGGGTMLTRGSRSISEEFSFKELEYGARHAHFEVLTDDPNKPAMTGDDIRLNFDLIKNIATIQPEKIGAATLVFPYAQMKTSITRATWNLEDSVVTMVKPEHIPIEDSYFFTTRTDLDSLAFNAEKGIYDINTQELNVQGIPYIIVADLKIIPEGNQTTILANSVLQKFENAEIIIDTLNGYHYLNRASIRIFSRNNFEGSAFYKQIIGIDTFDIRFDSFESKEVSIDDSNKKGKRKTRLMTVSGGEVLENQNFLISPGFFYKGPVTMYASKPALELDGYVKLQLADSTYDHWVFFKRTEGTRDVQLFFDNATFESGKKPSAGIHMGLRDKLYTTFVGSKVDDLDIDFYLAKGYLTFDATTKTYKIENPNKTNGSSYQGHTMHYSDSTKSIVFEGKTNFIDPDNKQIKLDASVLGVGNSETNEYLVDAMFSLQFSAPDKALDIMTKDLLDIIKRTGPPLANDISLKMLFKLANITDDVTAKLYEEYNLKKYTSLFSVSKDLEVPLFISGVKMKWSNEQKAWYNTTKLAISNIYDNDLNAKLNGFMEIKKDESGADIVNLFIQASPGVWYYFSYNFNQLILFSSNNEFNEVIRSKSNVDNSRSKEFILALGNQNETLKFINDFRVNYFGIKEPYDLVFPEDINLEDENFDTIEEEDDGFGFD